MVSEKRTPLIYLIEDDPGDVLLVKEAFREQCADCRLHVFERADAAWSYLQEKDTVAPDLILLDLNMPGLGGADLLKRLKDDPATAHIPVVMLTTSTRPEDILDCYRHHANAYLTKGDDLERFFGKVQAMMAFWFGSAELPHTQEAGRRVTH